MLTLEQDTPVAAPVSRVVSAVAVGLRHGTGDPELRRRRLEAMTNAVKRAQFEGVNDPEHIRDRIMRARRAVSREHADAEPMGLDQVLDRERREFLVGSAIQSEMIGMLERSPRSQALGAALAFLLRACDDNPAQLRRVLLTTEVEKDGRRTSILEAIRSTLR